MSTDSSEPDVVSLVKRKRNDDDGFQKLNKSNFLTTLDSVLTKSYMITLPSGQRLSVGQSSIDYPLPVKTNKEEGLKSKELALLIMTGRSELESKGGEIPQNTLKIAKRELWAEKYSPIHFIDLLSDDRANRMLLRWLKLWDLIVFKKPGPKFARPFDRQAAYDLERTICSDTRGRPVHKTVIVSGTSGTGKSSLVRVVAKHCGYRLVEVNLSNEQSLVEFQNTLSTLNQPSRSLSGPDFPQCLLLDEIDCASTQIINALIAILNRLKTNELKRPLVCVCNNPYLPTLRKLRSIALLIKLQPISRCKLVPRLRFILELEGVKCEEPMLGQLITRFSNDMRSCLNNLQFISSQTNGVDTTAFETFKFTASSATDYFEAVRRVFTPLKHKIGTENVNYLDLNHFICGVLNFERFVCGMTDM